MIITEAALAQVKMRLPLLLRGEQKKAANGEKKGGV
jgi:hypothetical protein